MAIIDYSETLDALQRALGTRYAATPALLNQPGRSLACRLDPYYDLAPYPGLIITLARWATIVPATVRDTLRGTASVLCGPPVTGPKGDVRPLQLRVTVQWDEEGTHRSSPHRTSMDACFLHSSFVDRALALYAPGTPALPVSGLRIAAEDRDLVREFLGESTELTGLAFA